MVNSDDCGDSIFLDFDRKMGKEKRYETTIHRKLIDCCKTLSNGGISERSDFASRKRDIYLTFILNCRSDYLVAYPQKEQRIYKTKLSRMKLTF